MPRLRPAPKKEEIEEAPEVKLHENEPEEEAAFETPENKEEPEVEVKEPEKKEDPALALQKQLDELKKSEELQRNQREQAIRERDEALKRAQERDLEVVKLQKETTQSQYDSIASALTAAQAEAERAAQDVEVAGNASDFKALADAQRRLARAEARIDKLEDGKFELEARVRAEKATPKVEPKVEPKQENQLPESAKQYLSKHPELLQDNRKNVKLQSLHWDAIDAGHEAYTQPYYEFLDVGLGYKKAEPKEEPKEQQRTNIVSAPVSREVPSSSGTRSNGKITLTAEEKEFAKISGVTEVEYAKQKQRLSEMKANGTYGDRQ